MNSSSVVEYLEKYSVAPSPSRDYYGIKVLRDQVILYTWKISHGPHTSPIVITSRFCDFFKEKTMHNEIERVFGEPILRHVKKIAQGNDNTLITIPKNLIKKLTTYLTFKDVLKLSTISHMAKEVFNGDIVWEVLYKRQKMGLVYKDEREQGSSYGWKRLFRERQMHKPARNREIKKLSSDHHLVTARSSTATLIKRPPSSSLSLKYQKGTTSGTKLLGTETQTPKFLGSKNSHNYIGRADTANKKKFNAEMIRGCKLFSTKKEQGDNYFLPETNKFGKISIREVEVRRPEEPSMIFKSRNKGISGDKEKTISDQTSTVSIIGARKNSHRKSHGSVKKFSNPGQKSNPSSTRGNKSEVVSNTESLSRRCEQKTFAHSAREPKDLKSSGKSVICKTEKPPLDKNRGVSSIEDFGFEELIRTSITAEYSNSDNLLPHDFWRDRIFESNSNERKESARKCSRANLSMSEKKSTIYKKFRTPRKPKAWETKCGAESTMIPAKKISDIKAYLKCNRKNFSGDETKLENNKVKVKSSSMRRIPDKTVTKHKRSCASIDSKLISIDSSQRSELKKRGNLKKL